MELVNAFKATRILNHGRLRPIKYSLRWLSNVDPDPVAHSVVLLGTINEQSQAILILKKTPFVESTALDLSWERLDTVESNDIVRVSYLQSCFATDCSSIMPF